MEVTITYFAVLVECATNLTEVVVDVGPVFPQQINLPLI